MSVDTYACAAPSNFVDVNLVNTLVKKRTIKETHLIDTSIEVPKGLLPPLGPNESQHKNLSMVSIFGDVTSTVYLVGDGMGPRAHLRAQSHHGSVVLDVYRECRTSFRADAHSDAGNVKIFIPRDFRGPITITRQRGYRAAKLSEGVKSAVTSFSNVGDVFRCYIGDSRSRRRLWKEKEQWQVDPDEVVAGSKGGTVSIFFNDEPHGSLWSKLFAS